MKKSMNRKQKLKTLADHFQNVYVDGEGPFPLLLPRRQDFLEPGEFDAAVCRLQVKRFVRPILPCDLPAELAEFDASHVDVREASPGIRIRVLITVAETQQN